MRAYFLIRESGFRVNAVIAAIKQNELPVPFEWLTGSVEIEYCLLDDQEFDRAKTYRGALVLSWRNGEEVAIVFGPRDEWPEEFGRFRNLLDKMGKDIVKAVCITEETWLGSEDRLFALVNFALPRSSVRKVRLFAVACCDLVADKMIDPRSLHAVEVALRDANGTASDEELNAAFHESYEAMLSIIGNGTRRSGVPDQVSPESGAAALACNTTEPLARPPTPDSPDGWLDDCCLEPMSSDFLMWHTLQAANEPFPVIAAKLTGLLRDICGNPFRLVVAEPAWQSSGLKALARAIYDLKAFDRLPELADALEAAGCEEPSVLNHCHSSGPHVRGCWVLDLVLGL